MKDVTSKDRLGLLIKCSKPEGEKDTENDKNGEQILASIIKAIVKPERDMPDGPNNTGHQGRDKERKLFF